MELLSQGLGLRNGIIPRMLVEAGAVGGSGTGDYLEPPGEDTWWNIPEEEQADVYCGWAESVLLKHRWVSRPMHMVGRKLLRG